MNRRSGFTLLEIMVVLGLIGSLGAFIIPSLGVSTVSQIRIATGELANTMRAAYDAAILESQIHRLVLKPKTGEYWAEALPLGFIGRPPKDLDAKDSEAHANSRAKLLEELDKVASEPRKSKEDEKRTYSFRSILLVQRKFLKPISWKEVDDPTLFRRSLPGSVYFKSLATTQKPEGLTFEEASDSDVALIYFFPSGEASTASIQIAVMGANKQMSEKDPKSTLNLDALSGQTQVVDGLVAPDEIFHPK